MSAIIIEMPEGHPLLEATVLVVGNDFHEVVVQRDKGGQWVIVDCWDGEATT